MRNIILFLGLIFSLSLFSAEKVIDNNLYIGTGDSQSVNILANTTGSSPYPTVRYNFTSGKWTFSNDGSTFSDFGSGGGGSMPDGTDKGDMLVWSGTAWGFLPVGADGQVLTADAIETLGIGWEDSSGGIAPIVSSTDNAIARWDGTSGGALKNSGVTIDASDNLATSGNISGANLTIAGATTLQSSLDGFIKATAGVISSVTGIDLDSEVGSSVLPVANGGTGSAVKNFVDLTTNQTVAGVKTLTSPVINDTISGTAILDEDDMSSNSNTQVATQQSIKKYVDDNAHVTPTTTRGDLIVRGAVSNERLPLGTPGQLLSSDGTDPVYIDPPSTSPTTTEGDIIVRGATEDERLEVDSSIGHVLASNGAGEKPSYKKIDTNINYITNPKFETGVTGWAGDGTLAITHETVAPLRGLGSLKISKDSDVSTKSVSTPFTIDRADLGQVLPITFDKDFSQSEVWGTYSNGDAIVRILKDPSGTPEVISVLSGADILANKDPHFAEFKADDTELDYALEIYWVDTGADDINVYAENVRIGPLEPNDSAYLATLSNTTNWQDFPSVDAGTLITSTGTNPTFGTISTNKARWRQVGENMEIEWDFAQTTAGTTGSGVYLFNLPAGYNIDSSKVDFNTNVSGESSTLIQNAVKGDINLQYAGGASSSKGSGAAIPYNSTQLKFYVDYILESGSSSEADFFGTFYSFSLGVMSISVRISVPIAGWTATTDAVVKKNKLLKVRADTLSGTNSATSFAFNYVTSINELEDDYNALTDIGDIIFTVPPEKSGYYTFDFGARVDYGAIIDAVECGVDVTSSTATDKTNTFANNTTQAYNKCFFRDMKLEAGDTVKFFVRKGGTDSVTWNTDTRWNYLTITEQPSSVINVATLSECQTKYLPSDITADTADIASLKFNNLKEGNQYEVEIYQLGDMALSGNDNLSITVKSNSIDRCQAISTGFDGMQSPAYNKCEFTAESSTLISSAGSISPGNSIRGNGTILETRVTLCESSRSSTKKWD